MALQGTIKDFALPDIFQLIGIQRKTGVLTLEREEETVTLKFLDGQVVGADTHSETLEDRLGELLVRTGRITEAQLKEALRKQNMTLQRLGYVLVSSGYISEEELIDALRLQSTQIIYRLFRWRDAQYHFDAVEDLDYDQRHFQPISSETILMEGARMIDEWPIIERRVKSDRMVLTRIEPKSAEGEEGALDSEIEYNLGLDIDRAGQEIAVKLSAEERQVLALVDGRRTVGEICDLVSIGEFDTWRILSDLICKNLVNEVRVELAGAPRETPWVLRSLIVGLQGLIGVAALFSLVTVAQNPLTPWRIADRYAMTDDLRRYDSLSRLERIDEALRVFYLNDGTFPNNLAVLASQGYIRGRDLQDPWGRDYRFQISAGGYQLSGMDAQGRADDELMIQTRFNSVQRLMFPQNPGAEGTPQKP